MNPADPIPTIAPEIYTTELLEVGEALRPDEINLAGEMRFLPQMLSRRDFLKGSAVVGASRFLNPRGAVRSISPTDLSAVSSEHETSQENATMISGQFTPYGRGIMGVNLFTRFCFESFYRVSEDPDAMAFLRDKLQTTQSDEDFMKSIQSYPKYNMVYRPDVFLAISDMIHRQSIPSARNSGAILSAKDLIASVVEEDPSMPVERMVAPQVLRFGQRNKLDYIFRRVDILPQERWEITPDGKPMLVSITPDKQTAYPAIIVDCLAGNSMNFYADLLHGVEKEIGGYSWNSQKGGFYVINNGEVTGHRINRIPSSSLNFKSEALTK